MTSRIIPTYNVATGRWHCFFPHEPGRPDISSDSRTLLERFISAIEDTTDLLERELQDNENTGAA